MRPKETKFFIWGGGQKGHFVSFLKNCLNLFFKKGRAKPFWKVCSNQEAF
jgi:hypothetical protein